MTFGNFSHNFTQKSLSPLKRTKQYRRIKKKFGGKSVEKIVAIFQGKPPARVFPLFKPFHSLKIHLFLRFFERKRYFALCGGRRGLCALDRTRFSLKEKRGKRTHFFYFLVCTVEFMPCKRVWFRERQNSLFFVCSSA